MSVKGPIAGKFAVIGSAELSSPRIVPRAEDAFDLVRGTYTKQSATRRSRSSAGWVVHAKMHLAAAIVESADNASWHIYIANHLAAESGRRAVNNTFFPAYEPSAQAHPAYTPAVLKHARELICSVGTGDGLFTPDTARPMVHTLHAVNQFGRDVYSSSSLAITEAGVITAARSYGRKINAPSRRKDERVISLSARNAVQARALPTTSSGVLVVAD